MKLLCFEIRYVGFRKLEKQIIEVLRKQSIISAIQLYRKRKNTSLIESKRYVSNLKDKYEI